MSRPWNLIMCKLKWRVYHVDSVYCVIPSLWCTVNKTLNAKKYMLSNLNFCHLLNPLTPELNPSAQRCLTRFLLRILLLEPYILLIYAWKTKKYNNYSLSLICIVAPTCFGITLPSSGSVPSAFWEMFNWGAVHRILSMGVFCLEVRVPRH
jgi:hypothetical protein